MRDIDNKDRIESSDNIQSSERHTLLNGFKRPESLGGIKIQQTAIRAMSSKWRIFEIVANPGSHKKQQNNIQLSPNII